MLKNGSLFIGFLMLFLLFGCAEIKPMQLPAYNAPDFSSIKRPVIEPLVEGKDYVFENDRYSFFLGGMNKFATKVISEETAWQVVEILKQTINAQTELIKQKDELIIVIDLKRQYAEKQKTYADVEKYASWVISLIAIALTLAR